MERLQKIVTLILQIAVLSYAIYATFQIDKLRREQLSSARIESNQQLIKSLEKQITFWKDKSARLN